jgi:hypothetical protein
MKNLFIIISFLLLLQVINNNLIIAQEKTDTNKTKVQKDTSKTVIVKPIPGVTVNPIPPSQDVLDTTAFKVNEFKIIGYPYLFYTPETQLAFGLGGMVYFRTALQPSQRPSKITLSGYYTTNNQYLISLKPRIYFPGKKRFYVESNFYFSTSILKYYGIGNNTGEIDSVNYKTTAFGIYVESQARGFLLNFLQLGLIYDYYTLNMKDKMSNPNLFDSTVAGTNGGKVGGMGFGWTFDDRDNISYPSSGGFYKISGIFYGRSLGGDFTFNKFTFDLRQFVAPIGDHILAFQLYSIMTAGKVPFFYMPAMGGTYIMRGVYQGRYIDENYLAFQAEYRKIVWWRLGIDAFYSSGDVCSNYKQLKLTQLKHAYGFGIRFVFDPKEKINLRADFGKWKYGSGVYFSMDEAF